MMDLIYRRLIVERFSHFMLQVRRISSSSVLLLSMRWSAPLYYRTSLWSRLTTWLAATQHRSPPNYDHPRSTPSSRNVSKCKQYLIHGKLFQIKVLFRILELDYRRCSAAFSKKVSIVGCDKKKSETWIKDFFKADLASK